MTHACWQDDPLFINMATVESGVKEAILNFAMTELSKPVTNHVYNFVKSELGASRHHVMTALLLAKETSEINHTIQVEQKPSQKIMNYESITSCSESDFISYFRMNRKTIHVSS